MELLQTKKAFVRKIVTSLGLVGFVCILSSCGEDGGNEITNAITFTVSRQAIVAPSNIESPENCPTEDVKGPRIRLSSSIKWEGNSRNLLPLSIGIEIRSPLLAVNEYNQLLTPNGGNESMSFMWDELSTDYIPPGPTTYASRCFLDFSALPRPINELRGNAQIKVRAKITLTGIARDALGEDVPFVKETETDIIYMSGSVPPE